MKAIQTSKHCNIICMYTAFTATDNNPNKGLPDSMDVQNTGVEYYQLTHTPILHIKLNLLVMVSTIHPVKITV